MQIISSHISSHETQNCLEISSLIPRFGWSPKSECHGVGWPVDAARAIAARSSSVPGARRSAYPVKSVFSLFCGVLIKTTRSNEICNANLSKIWKGKNARSNDGQSDLTHFNMLSVAPLVIILWVTRWHFLIYHFICYTFQSMCHGILSKSFKAKSRWVMMECIWLTITKKKLWVYYHTSLLKNEF